MKRTILMIALSSLAAVVALGCYEWRYSGDMEEHISAVNRDLTGARLEAGYARGLIGSLQAMTTATNVAGEIIDTRNHVHTLKDELLARKIKQAAEHGVTVGGAIQMVIAKWPESI